MTPTRVGDSYTFDLTPGVLPSQQIVEHLGVLPEETYHCTITGEVEFTEPVVEGEFNYMVVFDLDGFDATTQAPYPSFDSGLYCRLQASYTSPGLAYRRLPFVDQAVVAVPPACLLGISKAGNGVGQPEIRLVRARLVFTIISPTTV